MRRGIFDFQFVAEPTRFPAARQHIVRSGGGFEIAIVDLGGGGTRIVSSGENPVWGADSRHIMFTEGGGRYLLDTVTSHKSKILDGLGKITEPSWSRQYSSLSS